MKARASILRLAGVVAFGVACGGPPPPVPPRDPLLRAAGVELYRAEADTQARPRAFLFFFGNDVGFWGPYRELATRLAGAGFATAGFDMRALLRALPDAEPARDSAFVARIRPLIDASRTELGAGDAPALVGGHSLGAEVAVWLAVHAPPAGLVGVLDLSPGARGHLRVTLADIANTAQPTEAGSFAIADEVRALAPGVRFALVRGANDRYGDADADILRAGGDRARRFDIPMAGHSLKRLTLVAPVVRAAAEWLLAPAPPR